MLKVLGITSDITTCSRCGREDLKKTIVVQDVDTGDIEYYGSECGSMIIGYDRKELAKQVRKAQKEQEEIKKQIINNAIKKLNPAYSYAENHKDYKQAKKEQEQLSYNNNHGMIPDYKEFLKLNRQALDKITMTRKALIKEYCIDHELMVEYEIAEGRAI